MHASAAPGTPFLGQPCAISSPEWWWTQLPHAAGATAQTARISALHPSESGTGGTVADCSGDGDACPDSWVGDGYCDGADQVYGCDLTCHDNDGGDCEPPPTDWGTSGAGWCDSDLDESVGATVSAQACWDKCVDTHGADVIKAIDWWSGECVCAALVRP